MRNCRGLAGLNRAIVSCRKCPRLVRHREKTALEKRAAYRSCAYWGKPVPGFGDPGAELLIVGLAPAAHGGNRTGRMFTGDGSADFLIPAMHHAGLANMPTSERRGDGLRLKGAYLTAVCRCAPPDNAPTRSELASCRPFLLREISVLKNIRAVLALGKIALDGYLAALKDNGYALKGVKFAHGAEYPMPAGLPRLFASYHPSRQNTQTGRLTRVMLDRVLLRIRRNIETLRTRYPSAGCDKLQVMARIVPRASTRR